MSPSSTLPSVRQPSSFGSVDWLSQSSRVGPSHTSRPAEFSWRRLSAPARVSSSRELPQTVGMGEKSSEVSSPGTPTAGRSADGWGGCSLPGLGWEPGRVQWGCLDWGWRWGHSYTGWGWRFYLTPLASKHLLSEAKASREVFPPQAPWGSSSPPTSWEGWLLALARPPLDAKRQLRRLAQLLTVSPNSDLRPLVQLASQFCSESWGPVSTGVRGLWTHVS